MGARGPQKKEKEKRISGTGYDIKTQPGAAAIAQLKYKAETSPGIWEIDVKAIDKAIKGYIDSNTDNTVSRVGLRIALDISRETYNEWLQGYVDKADVDNDEVKANIALATALRAGDDRIMQYLVETCDKYGDTKRIRLLETYGEIAPAQSKVSHDVNINLGKHTKYSK